MRMLPLALLLRRTRPRFVTGLIVAALFIAAETSLTVLFPVTPARTLDLVYLLGILAVAVWGGVRLGLLTALASAIAFDLFVTAPMWSLRLTAGEFLVTLAIFLVIALPAGAVSVLSGSLAAKIDAWMDADLSAELAGVLLRAPDLKVAMPTAARHLARAFGLPSTSIEPGVIPADDKHRTFPLRDGDMLATLVVPADLTETTLRRLERRTVPSLKLLLRAAHERETITNTARARYEELRRIANEQAALRNLAMLVANNACPSEVFDAVAREMGQVLGARHTVIVRYESDGAAVLTVGTWNYDEFLASGTRWEVREGTVSDLVFRTRAPGRVHGYGNGGELAARLRECGVLSSVGCPIIVDHDIWGAAIASSSTPEGFPADTEEHMCEFTELAATAIANAQSRADLIASRARVVAATDETRRRIERDLHDGTQQHLVSIGLEMRSIAAAMPPELDQLKHNLSKTARALDSAVRELQEISRGLHPAILARGGLKSALSVLARRSALDVRLDFSAPGRLPERVEVTVYYIVSEALTNATKYACAKTVYVDLATTETLVRLSIRDDGIGGADPAHGSGLSGLIDRVTALGGRMDITSRAGEGTTLRAEMPYESAG
jgi:signal transduction histidine kinase